MRHKPSDQLPAECKRTATDPAWRLGLTRCEPEPRERAVISPVAEASARQTAFPNPIDMRFERSRGGRSEPALRQTFICSVPVPNRIQVRIVAVRADIGHTTRAGHRM